MSIQVNNIIDIDAQILLYKRSIASGNFVLATSCVLFSIFLAIAAIGYVILRQDVKANYVMVVSGIAGMVGTIAFAIIGIKLLDCYWKKCGLRKEELLQNLTAENKLYLINQHYLV